MNPYFNKVAVSTLGEEWRQQFALKAAELLADYSPIVEISNELADMWEVRVTWGAPIGRREYSGIFSVNKRGLTQEEAMQAGLDRNYEQLKLRFESWLKSSRPKEKKAGRQLAA